MKLLAVHGILPGIPIDKQKAVDLWRIKRPLDELKKHVDWQIDEQPTFIPGIEKYKDASEFTPEELEAAAVKLGQYDIIWSTYFTNPTFYALLRAVHARYGTKFVMDVDDDLFAIKQDNPIWLKLRHENVYHMQCMVRDADYITTTTEEFAHKLRSRRPDKAPESVYVMPNYISDDYKHDPVDNGDRVVIGYFGGSSHIWDIDQSGMVEAVERLMHENKSVRFVSCGFPIEKYLPRGRYTYLEGKPSTGWVDEVFPSLNFDIALGPLEDAEFARGKSNIKWQEATRMGAAFVASDVGPYKDLSNGVNALLVKNTSEDWYKALKKLVNQPKLRRLLVHNAREDLRFWRLEVNWPQHKEAFEKIRFSDTKILTLAEK
jgi:glycosyltransferase involved in cell wall biosynthesis